MYNNTISALEIILKEEYDKQNPLSSFRHLSLGNQLFQVKKGETILYQSDPVKHFYFLLRGRALILNHISFTTDNIVDYVQPPHIIGIWEYLIGTPTYTAYVVADTACTLFRVPADSYIELIKKNSELCYQNLLIIGKVSNQNMERAEKQRVFPQIDILGHYLYFQSKNQTPYKCPLTRKVLAEELSINLRTLYRYLTKMEEQGYIKLQHGKIVIDESNLEKLTARYDDIIL